jgi:serine protease Do
LNKAISEMRNTLLLACLLACLPAAAADYGAYQKAAASVIRVAASVPGAGTSFGSGVVLPGGRVVTNCHVIPDVRMVGVMDGAARTEAMRTLGDAGADLCVLDTGALAAPPAQLGSASTLRVGDEVVAIGFGGGSARSISTGRVTALFPYRGGQVIRTSAAFRQGASGGGLFDRHGRLVGITTFYRRGESGFSFFAIPVEWIDALDLEEAAKPSQPRPFWMRAHAEQPHFLQVATLEADGKWGEMAEAARLWTEDEPAQAQSWDALIRALDAQGQLTEGNAARQRARAMAGSQ